MSTFKIVICHFSFPISHLSFLICHTKQRLLLNLLKGLKMCIINIAKVFTCSENFDKKYYFFSGSVFENKTVKQISNHTNQSATIKK